MIPRPVTPATFDLFGTTVAMDDAYLVVGASSDDVVANHAGAVYVFEAQSGGYLYALYPPNVGTTHGFGLSLSIQNEQLLVGANAFHPTNAAYLIDLKSGETVHTFTAPESDATSVGFGEPVVLDGDLVIVGARGNSVEHGAVYVFDRVTFEHLHTLESSTPSDGASFGRSVAVNDGVIAVGADGDDEQAFNAGAVFLFDRTTGALIEKIVDEDGDNVDRFGYSVSLSGNTLAVGAPFYDSAFYKGHGALYFFDIQSGATQTGAVYNDTDDRSFYVFTVVGSRVLMSYDDAVVAHAIPSGAVVGSVVRPGPDVFGFGVNIAIDDGKLLVGSNGTNTHPGPARVHLYSNVLQGFFVDLDGDGCVGAQDIAVLLAAWGSPSADLNLDGQTDAIDLAILLASWGGC